MASSLEDLLAEDGFRGRKSLMRSRTSFRAESPTLPPFPFSDRLKKDFMPTDRIRTGRSRSDISRHATQRESPTSDRTRGSTRLPRDSLVRRDKTKMDSWYPKKEATREKHEHGNVCEIVEVQDEENESVKDIYSNEVYSLDSGKDKQYSNGDMRNKGQGNGSKRHVVGRSSFSDNNRREMKQSQQLGKGFEAVSEPALDEVAIQAMVSILSGYIKRFLKDEEFRAALRRNCLSSLSVVDVEEDGDGEIKIITKLEEAIEAIERAVEESTSTKDLKKAVLQLSVILGLNSNDLKDGFTSGIPNHKLSACAHLYLSVVYKLQKKDHAAAKHLLQVFCDSPFLARTKLLPELWDYLFFPHLSHLNAWYDQEADSLTNKPGKPRKLKLLARVYNEIMDSGTYQFAVYYKDWLTEGVETSPVPSIHVPSASIRKTRKESSSRGPLWEMSSSSSELFSPQLQPMVSEKFYNAVFRHSGKSGSEESKDSENSDNWVRSSDALVKDTLTHSCESVKETDHDVEQDLTKSPPDHACFPENYGHLETSEEKWTFLEERVSSTEKNHHLSENCVESETCQEKPENAHMMDSLSHIKENEHTITSQPQSQFELQPPDSELTKGRPSSAEPQGLFYSEEETPSFSTIPQDFICPLTGELFKEPATLETGQTFERKAIKAWFDQGNTTCPVTGKTLECKQLVPFTNLVLKRVIETWKLQNFSALALDHVRIANNIREFMSLGGLKFLLQRFGAGNMEERTRISALLICCIESDSGCRNRIAREIDRKCLVELLHSKQVKARESAVLLLVELICLKRKIDIIGLLSELKSEKEGIEKTMHVVLVYLQNSPSPQKPLVAVLLLHFDLLVEPRKYSIYREEAVDAITESLYSGLNDDKIRKICRRVLLILGGHFSTSGELLTQSWILNQAGFKANAVVDSPGNEEEEEEEEEESTSLDDEEHSKEHWQRNLCASILGNGKRSFLEAISKCLGSKNMDLVTACLTTVAWLSAALASMPQTELQLRAFSILISRLKDCLENGQCVEHKVLASTSLLNFSKISECRVILMSMAENITVALRSLVEVTWTAKRLYTVISGEAF